MLPPELCATRTSSRTIKAVTEICATKRRAGLKKLHLQAEQITTHCSPKLVHDLRRMFKEFVGLDGQSGNEMSISPLKGILRVAYTGVPRRVRHPLLFFQERDKENS